jgi:hypothetical protein
MKKNIAFAFSLLGTISSSGLFASSASEGKEDSAEGLPVLSVKVEKVEKGVFLEHFRQQVETARSLLEKRPEQFKALRCIDQVREAWEETHFDLDKIFVGENPVERIGYIFNRLRNPVSPKIFEVLRYFAFPDPTETLLKVLSLLADSRLGLDALYRVMPEKLDLEGEMCGLPVNPAARWDRIFNFYNDKMKGRFTRCAVTMSMESHKASIIYEALAATNLSEALAAAGLETTILKMLKSPERENQRKGITNLLLRRLMDASLEIPGSSRFLEALCLNEYGLSLVKEAIGGIALKLKGVDWQSIFQEMGIKRFSVEDAVLEAKQEEEREQLVMRACRDVQAGPTGNAASVSKSVGDVQAEPTVLQTSAANVPTTLVVAEALAFIDPTETFILRKLKSTKREDQREGMRSLLTRLVSAGSAPVKGRDEFIKMLCLNEDGFLLLIEAIEGLAPSLRDQNLQSILQMSIREEIAAKQSAGEGIPVVNEAAASREEPKVEVAERRGGSAANVQTTSVVAQALTLIDPTETFILSKLKSTKREDNCKGIGELLARLVNVGSLPVKGGAEFLKMLCLNEDGLLLVKEAIEGLAPSLRERNWQSILQEMGIREENAAKQSAGEGIPVVNEAAASREGPEEVKEPYVEPNERGVRDTAPSNADSALVRGLQESLNSAAAEEAKNLNKVLKTSTETAADEERVRRFKEKHGSGTHSADAMAQRDWRIAIGDDELVEWSGVDGEEDEPYEEEGVWYEAVD